MFLSNRHIVRTICILSISLYLLHYVFRAVERYYSIENAIKRSTNYGANSFSGLMKRSGAFPIYIVNAYVIADNKIRITLITKCKYSPSLTVYIGQHYSTATEYEYFDNCPPHWLPKCNYGGRFANAVLPKEEIEEVLHRKSSIFIGYSSEPYVRKRIRLIDSRVDSSRPRPHRLAICVSPIMQLAAWVLLPRFFEMWILHGATKFYTMVQSMTSEFDAMLRIYENDPTIDIERIPWGMLPTDEDVASENNPNNQIPGADVEKQIIL